jgi:hypothetical protein
MSAASLAIIGLFTTAMTQGIFYMMFGRDMDPGLREECRLTLKKDAMLLHQIDTLLCLPSSVSNSQKSCIHILNHCLIDIHPLSCVSTHWIHYICDHRRFWGGIPDLSSRPLVQNGSICSKHCLHDLFWNFVQEVHIGPSQILPKDAVTNRSCACSCLALLFHDFAEA